jgi:hypothetical protein
MRWESFSTALTGVHPFVARARASCCAPTFDPPPFSKSDPTAAFHRKCGKLSERLQKEGRPIRTAEEFDREVVLFRERFSLPTT